MRRWFRGSGLSSAAMSFRTAMSRHPPIVHKDDHTIRGPMFCSFLAPGVAQGTGGSAGSGRVHPRMGRHRARSGAVDRNRGRARQLALRNTAPTVPHRPAHARVASPPLVRCVQPPARHDVKNAAAVVPTPVLRLLTLDLGYVSRVSCRRFTVCS
jgi:hypothetical protein